MTMWALKCKHGCEERQASLRRPCSRGETRAEGAAYDTCCLPHLPQTVVGRETSSAGRCFSVCADALRRCECFGVRIAGLCNPAVELWGLEKHCRRACRGNARQAGVSAGAFHARWSAVGVTGTCRKSSPCAAGQMREQHLKHMCVGCVAQSHSNHVERGIE